MSRPQRQYPIPRLRHRGGRWQITWWRERHYQIATKARDPQRAEVCRLEVELALRTGRWPPWAAEAPGMRAYIQEQGMPRQALSPEAVLTAPDLITAYESVLRAKSKSVSYQRTCLGHLRDLQRFAGKPLEAITVADTTQWLTSIVAEPPPGSKAKRARSAGTHNRALTAAHVFYAWAVNIGRLPSNPVAGQKRLREPGLPEIIYLTPRECRTVLAVADTLPDGLAVQLALHAGLRRGEIGRLMWNDVAPSWAVLSVRRSKTGTKRAVPIATALRAKLEAIPPDQRTGRLVGWPVNEDAAARASERLLTKLRAACRDIPAERIGWNSFRHSFCSLHVQAGTPLDIVAAWAGHTPAVARRHYAEFVPSDKRDTRIDLPEDGDA